MLLTRGGNKTSQELSRTSQTSESILKNVNYTKAPGMCVFIISYRYHMFTNHVFYWDLIANIRKMGNYFYAASVLSVGIMSTWRCLFIRLWRATLPLSRSTGTSATHFVVGWTDGEKHSWWSGRDLSVSIMREGYVSSHLKTETMKFSQVLQFWISSVFLI